MHPGQGAGNLAGRRVGRSAARRHQGQVESRCQGERAGAETRGQADAARGRPEGDRRISGSSADKTTAGKLLFTGLFDTLNGQRSSVMNGLERITRKQRTAAGEDPRPMRPRCRRCRDPSAPDQSKIEELGNQLVWQTRIFEERQRVVKFVCEVPTAIDQRLFALGRVIQQEME